VCRDPRDDYLVALAVASGAEAIVTGDLDLLASDPDEVAIEVVHPAPARRAPELTPHDLVRFFRTASLRAASSARWPSVQGDTAALRNVNRGTGAIGTRKASSTAARRW